MYDCPCDPSPGVSDLTPRFDRQPRSSCLVQVVAAQRLFFLNQVLNPPFLSFLIFSSVDLSFTPSSVWLSAEVSGVPFSEAEQDDDDDGSSSGVEGAPPPPFRIEVSRGVAWWVGYRGCEIAL